jgi:4'-phosphopantetheinyl transferase
VKIYIAKVIDQYDNSVLALLDSKRRERLDQLKVEKEKLRSISAGLLFRHAFLDMHSGKSSREWDEVSIKYGEYGKPYVEGYEEFHYSISHSGEYVLCATDNSEIGADIQEMRKWNPRTAKRFFDESEYTRITNMPDAMQTREFYRIWTAKESVAKLSGRGLGAGIEHLVTNREYSKIKDIRTDTSFNIRMYEEVEGYIICICSREKAFPENLQIIKL